MTTPLPALRRWHDLCSDVNWIDYGGSWARRIDATRYFVIIFENCAEWGDGATGYHVSLREVQVTSDQLPEALSYIGADEEEREIGDLEKVYALASYGAYAPLFQDAGHNAHALMRAAKSEAQALASDREQYESAMDRPVNAIGSTAREYQSGDLNSAILRGVERGDQRAEILLRMKIGNGPKR